MIGGSYLSSAVLVRRGRGGRRKEETGRAMEVGISISHTTPGASLATRFFKVVLGDHTIETTFTSSEADVAEWVCDVQRVHRQRLRGHLRRGNSANDGSIIVGACIFRGEFPSLTPVWEGAAKPTSDERAAAVLCLCASAGHQCLVLTLDGPTCYPRLPFPRSLRNFLGDRRVRLVGIDMAAGARTLEVDWGVHVAGPMELKPLVAGAFGRDALPAPRRRSGGAGWLREVAGVALEGVDAGKKPDGRGSSSKDYGLLDHVHVEDVKNVTVDAFLCCEVGRRCLEIVAGLST